MAKGRRATSMTDVFSAMVLATFCQLALSTLPATYIIKDVSKYVHVCFGLRVSSSYYVSCFCVCFRISGKGTYPDVSISMMSTFHYSTLVPAARIHST